MKLIGFLMMLCLNALADMIFFWDEKWEFVIIIKYNLISHGTNSNGSYYRRYTRLKQWRKNFTKVYLGTIFIQNMRWWRFVLNSTHEMGPMRIVQGILFWMKCDVQLHNYGLSDELIERYRDMIDFVCSSSAPTPILQPCALINLNVHDS